MLQIISRDTSTLKNLKANVSNNLKSKEKLFKKQKKKLNFIDIFIFQFDVIVTTYLMFNHHHQGSRHFMYFSSDITKLLVPLVNKTSYPPLQIYKESKENGKEGNIGQRKR